MDIFFEDVAEIPLNHSEIELWLAQLCKGFQKELDELTIIFCSDEYLLEMNRTHLNHDYYTDIITFDYCQNGQVSGDLFISLDRVAENAEAHKQMFHVELFRVIAHGTLHLLGFKDKSKEDAAEMRRQEDLALRAIVPRET